MHAARSSLVACLVALALVPVAAQLRVQPVADQDGRVALGLLLRRLGTIGSLMMATAHPDDENSALLAMAAHGFGFKTVLATATRGDGGQNEIGPELADALAVLRTEELAAAHRFDGAEQYFTRAVDFGFSFSVEETYDKWGKDEIVGDYVRLIRTHRPDVVLALRPDGEGGGQHHQASARLAHEAFRAAGDPRRYPDQIREGLRPWRPKKFYFMAAFGFPGEPPPPANVKSIPFETSVYDPLLGRTYSQIGAEARSMHKCQSMPQVLPLGGGVARYYLADSFVGDGPDLFFFGGIRTRLPDLARYAGPDPPGALVAALEQIATRIENARERLNGDGPDAAAPVLASGLEAVRALRAALPSMGSLDASARFEIDFRLREKERQFQDAVLLAHGIRLEALADDGVVTAGQGLKLTLFVANRGLLPATLGGITLGGFESAKISCPASTLPPGEAATCTAWARIPTNAAPTTPYFRRLPDAARYEFHRDAPFGLPFEPTPFVAAFDLELSGTRLSVTRQVEHRYQADIFAGEKRMELHVVPALAVQMSPEILVFPREPGRTGGGGAPGSRRTRDVHVSVTNASDRAVTGEIVLDLPQGWSSSPASIPVRFTRQDESQTVRFLVSAPATGHASDAMIRARVSARGPGSGSGFQVVEYPHIHRRHLMHEAVARAMVTDISVAQDRPIGYVMGVGDEVPGAIEQLGATVESLGPDDLASADLSAYRVIVLGIRAYERRADLRANNARLLRWVDEGGTLIVQYNRFEFNQEQYGPYPAKVGRERITDENAPVKLLVPNHPIFTAPNGVGERDWRDWVQERGLYFLDERDPRYVDLVALEDPFPYNGGEKRGALVEARYGRGRWIYVGLGLWRQLAAGTEGAYRLLANLVSLGEAQ